MERRREGHETSRASLCNHILDVKARRYPACCMSTQTLKRLSRALKRLIHGCLRSQRNNSLPHPLLEGGEQAETIGFGRMTKRRNF